MYRISSVDIHDEEYLDARSPITPEHSNKLIRSYDQQDPVTTTLDSPRMDLRSSSKTSKMHPPPSSISYGKVYQNGYSALSSGSDVENNNGLNVYSDDDDDEKDDEDASLEIHMEANLMLNSPLFH